MKQEETKQKEEKIIPLFEDLKGHKQDDASFEKAMAAQNETRKAMQENKNPNN